LAKLDPETKLLRKRGDGELADEVGLLQDRIETLKAEAIRRELRRVEGQHYRLVLTAPAYSQRTDKTRLLQSLGITAAEFASRFCYPVQSGWRLTCTALRKLQAAA
jgi:hypothetical protein